MQTVTFKAKDVFGRDITIMDSFNNVQIVEKGLARIYKAMNEVEKKKGEDLRFLDYSSVITPIVIEETCTLLGKTNKDDKEQMKKLSYSYIQNFYADACIKFTGIELPTVQSIVQDFKRAQALQDGAELKDGEEAVDPK